MKKDVKVKSETENKRLKLRNTWLICSAIFVVLLAVLIVVPLLPKQDSPSDSNSIYYYHANYDEDIFKNLAYMGYERDLIYSASGVTKEYRFDEDYETAPVECQFFLDYFHAVINGRYEEFSRFFVEDYFEAEPKFTMQMIYEPFVSVHSAFEEEIDGETQTVYNFNVRYRIFKNNGTFRQGVASNQAIPQVYQLIKTEDGYRIWRILDVTYED